MKNDNSGIIAAVYDLLKDIVNADDNREPYTGEELHKIAVPIINDLWRILPENHPDADSRLNVYSRHPHRSA